MSGNLVRKYFDIGPASTATSVVYTGGTTAWQVGSPTATGFTVDAGSCPSCWLTQLAQSDDEQGRIGQSVALETLDSRIKINWDLTAAVGVTDNLRIIIVADQECDGTNPSYLEVLGNTATQPANGIMLEFLQPGYFGRFKVIYDEYFSNTQNGGIADKNKDASVIHQRHHDLHDHRVMWDATNGSLLTNARKGHIFMYMFYERTTVAVSLASISGTNTAPSVQFKFRFRYRDL